ncbi:hypothetical protein LX32DRAFT_657424 [Colletotrichum zoysiae]|uniref:Uncharacterized protein n=1 Tax=Colletotrichum zoysiae TaxID=1216348 RepID=A0AAD9H6S5_9PEZI|nr:hypothetical protein LX32DRAFT_657424 [Colletotrichum zoysiae]
MRWALGSLLCFELGRKDEQADWISQKVAVAREGSCKVKRSRDVSVTAETDGPTRLKQWRAAGASRREGDTSSSASVVVGRNKDWTRKSRDEMDRGLSKAARKQQAKEMGLVVHAKQATIQFAVWARVSLFCPFAGVRGTKPIGLRQPEAAAGVWYSGSKARRFVNQDWMVGTYGYPVAERCTVASKGQRTGSKMTREDGGAGAAVRAAFRGDLTIISAVLRDWTLADGAFSPCKSLRRPPELADASSTGKMCREPALMLIWWQGEAGLPLDEAVIEVEPKRGAGEENERVEGECDVAACNYS